MRDVPAGMGAARAGLVVDDEIVAIDGKATRAMSAEEIHGALVGDVGSTVTLTILHGSTSRDVKVERGPLQGPLQQER